MIKQGNKHTHTRTHARTHAHTQAVITWFKAIQNKRSSSLIKFNVVDFYPSMLKEVLTKSIHYAKSITTFEEEVIETDFHAHK